VSHLSHIRSKKMTFWVRRGLRKIGIGTPPKIQAEPFPPSAIPCTLWIYWDQGFEAAPELVRACVQSWRGLNPGWDVRLIDANLVDQLVEMPDLPASISSAHKADVLRTRLLAVHGGVWTDATTWCLRPLNEWLPIAGYAGFFAFNWQNSDAKIITVPWKRTIGNWFIAAAPSNPLALEWDRIACEYWQNRERATNYFWHNDALEYAVGHIPSAQEVWDAMPKLSAGPAHYAWLALEHGTDHENARSAIATGAIPLQKLSWRMKATVSDVRAILDV